MKIFLPILSILLFTQMKGFTQATRPYRNCPNVNIAIVRAGTNADVTNPYFLYHVNNFDGTMTLMPGGPYKDPANPAANLQVNGVGVNRKDGFIYGLAFEGTSTTVAPTVRFMRLDSTYGVTSLGNIPAPVAGPGLIGVINPAAGETDTSGNFYFSAFTVNPNPTPTIDKFYLGKISNVQAITSGPPVVEYFEVIVTGSPNCSAYVTSLSADPNNSGLKDFSFNAKTRSFWTYATYKNPGASNFSAQVLELTPVAGGGTSPIRYQLNCNSIVNTHTAETSGTLIDFAGKFTVLFTDGTFGVANRNPGGIYDGTFTFINTSTGLPNPLRGDMGSCGQEAPQEILPPTPVPNPFDCPGNYAVVRAGVDADANNPNFLYMVDGITGMPTLLPGGPLRYPGTSQLLQLNGIGVNKEDGFIYGMAIEGATPTARFVKTDANYNVTLLGVIPPPTNADGSQGIVNVAAGDMDQKGNYFFTAYTTKAANGSRVLDKIWIGRIDDVSTLTGAPTPVYYNVDWSGSPCADFISSLDLDPNNSGIRDFYYHPINRSFFSYVTYKLPGDNQFRGQLIEIRPIGGPNSPSSYKMHCTNDINMHSAQSVGTMVTNEREFLVLMTDGIVGILPRTGNSNNFSGEFEILNNHTGLPSVLRGDFASCVDLEHPSDNPGPSKVINFTLAPNPVRHDQNIVLIWSSMPEPTTVMVVIYDTYGTVVRTINNAVAVDGSRLTIDAGNLAAGVYVVRATTPNGKSEFRLKFIKAN